MRKFVLASQSPRRRELLQALGVNFRILPDHSPEMANDAVTPAETVKELAKQKAQNIASLCSKEEIIIAADTMVFLGNNLLGKPTDADSAKEMLQSLSGNTHEVYTGVCILDMERMEICTDYERTEVTFRPLLPEEIERYIASGEPMDKAGGYGIQGTGALFVEKINGDYFNVMGLPLCKLGKILNEKFGISLL